MISDIVLLKKLPETIRKSRRAYVGCVSGATMKNEYLVLMKEAGFQAAIYELTTKACLATLLNSINLDKLLMRVDDDTPTAVPAALISAI